MNANFRSAKLYRITLCGAAIAAVFFSQFLVQGQSDQEVGFFSIVNTVALPTNTMIEIDKQQLRKEGLKTGEMVGPLGMAAATHNIAVSNANARPASLALSLKQNVSPIVIVYQVENPDGTRDLKLYARGNLPEANRKAFSAIYAGKSAVTLSFNGQPQTLQPLREVVVGGENSTTLTIDYNKNLVATFEPEESGNYLVVLHDLPQGRLGAVTVQDRIHRVAR